MSGQTARAGARGWLALAAICVLALALRLCGIDRLLPLLPEPDAFVVYEMQALQHDPASISDGGFDERYPALLARALALIPRGEVPAGVERESESGERSLERHLARAASPFLRVRVAVALLAWLLVSCTWLVARRLLRAQEALLAAAFVAFSLLHLSYSQQARPHGVEASLTWISILASIRAMECPSWKGFIGAGVAATLAIACLQSGVFVIPPLVLSIVLMRASSRLRWGLATVIPLVALGFAAYFYPHLPFVDSAGLHLAGQGSHTIRGADLNGKGWLRAVELSWSHDPVLAILALGGVCLWIVRAVTRSRNAEENGQRASWVVAAYALPYLAFLGLDGEIFDRLLLPLLPVLAFSAASAVIFVGERSAALAVRVTQHSTGSPRGIAAGAWTDLTRRSIVAFVIALSLAFPAYASLRFSLAARAPNTLEQTAEWLEHEVDSGVGARTARVLVSPSVVLPIFWAEEELRSHMAQARRDQAPWIVYQSLLPASTTRTSFRVHTLPYELATRLDHVDAGEIVRYLAELSPDYVIVEQSPRSNWWPMLRYLRQAAVAYGTPVFESHGQAPDIATLGSVDYQDVRELATRILATSAFGPGITVYRMKH